jgi:hypothetical protein
MDQTFREVRTALARFVEDDAGSASDAIRFPCPAPLDAGLGDPAYGHEICPADINGDGRIDSADYSPGDTLAGGSVRVIENPGTHALAFVGALPTATLGIPGQYGLDSGKNRLTYAVSASLLTEGSTADFAARPEGAIRILGEGGSVLTENGDFILLAHGKDGAGSYNAQGRHHGVSCRATTDGDARNCAWQSDNLAVFREQTGLSLQVADPAYYDDRIAFTLIDEKNGETWWEAINPDGKDITNKNPERILIGENVAGADAGDKVFVDGNVRAGADIYGNNDIHAGNRVVASKSVQVCNDASPCTPALAGSIRWTGSDFEGCDGSNWTSFKGKDGANGVSVTATPTTPAAAMTQECKNISGTGSGAGGVTAAAHTTNCPAGYEVMSGYISACTASGLPATTVASMAKGNGWYGKCQPHASNRGTVSIVVVARCCRMVQQ